APGAAVLGVIGARSPPKLPHETHGLAGPSRFTWLNVVFMGPEIWTTGIAHVQVAPRAAARAEAAGFDGMVVVDSQNLSGDPYVALALAAKETTGLRLGTGVTNPATRHPAATAAAIASVHVTSN